MENLRNKLEIYLQKLPGYEQFKIELKNIQNIFPFNEIEYIFAKLLSNNIITFEEYKNLRNEYIKENINLPLFEIMSPRIFGDIWAINYLKNLVPELKIPNKKIDNNYNGEYDLYLEYNNQIIKIEVKASRCVDIEKSNKPLYFKALLSNSNNSFMMNFQQLKPSCCDVFIWIAVYLDIIKIWVLNSNDVKNHKNFCSQHRKEKKEENIFEGQIIISEKNINTLNNFLIFPENLKEIIINAYQKKCIL